MKKYLITVNETQYEVEVVEVKNGVVKTAQHSNAAPKLKTSAVSNKSNNGTSSHTGQKVNAPMPGNVLKVLVEVGEVVKKGQKLLMFEAMKMENDLTSPCDGKVVEIKTAEGSVMAAGDLLMVIE
jgi:glutaconyl-CoA/methylmalonyl-CoA decarboxylase subunit gamma